MFERFSKEARAAVIAAQQAARDAGSRQIDTRHVLIALAERPGPARDALGAVDDPAGLAARIRTELQDDALDGGALSSLGIDLDEVRRRADETFGPGALDQAGWRRRPGRFEGGHMPFARDAKKSLELALREAVRLGSKSIDGGKLLLGILRADCPGRRALETAGVDVAALRAAVEHPDAESA